MNKEWYNIDVKKEVLREIEEYIKKNNIKYEVVKYLESVSVRDMMDIEYLKNVSGISDVNVFSDFVSKQYYKYRTLKYGQEGFWKSAASERDIGYAHKWHEYITILLSKYCNSGDNVLFVGTADGSEIPYNHKYCYYALEQIGTSIDRLDKNKVIESYKGDFEDTEFIIDNGHKMNAIVALRCLMPNTRLDKFITFIDNNICNNAVLIVSHPMGYLDNNGVYGKLPNCDKTRVDFDKRLNKVIKEMHKWNIIDEFETKVEYFYVIKVR